MQSNGQGYRLSELQERLWLEGQEQPGLRSQCSITLEGTLDAVRLRRALGAVVAGHEILRTTYYCVPGLRVPLQRIEDDLPPAWEEVDGAGIDLERVLDRCRRASFDAESGPVLRATLVRQGSACHVLVLTALSVTADPEALVTVGADLCHAYAHPDTRAVGDDRLQYADYAEWHHETRASADPAAEQGRVYWEGFESSVPPPSVPFERIAPPDAPFEPERVVVPIGWTTLSALDAAARRHGADIPTFAEACWRTLLGRLSGEPVVAVDSVVDGRHHDEQAGAVGPYARLLPLHTRLADDPLLAEVLDRVARARAEAFRWQDWAPDRPLPHRFSRIACHIPANAGGVSFTVQALSPAGGRFRLHLVWRDSDGDAGSPAADLYYDPAAFSRDSAERIARQFAVLLHGAVTDPSPAISRLALLTDEDRRNIVVDLNATGTDFPATACIHHLFEEQVRRTPDRAAVASATAALTYRQLNERANQLAHLLRDRGVGPDVPVGLCMGRTVEMFVAVLGILKAGGAYVPLHMEHPPARLAHQLDETRTPVLLTEEGLLDRFEAFAGDAICIDRDSRLIDGQDTAAPPRVGRAEDLVYVMYTSGSTGLPKGVAVTHGNLVNYATFIMRELGVGGDAEPLQFGMVSPISTDLGNTTVFPALLSGGCLQLISPDAALDAELLAAETARRPIDVLKITPSHLAALLSGPEPAKVLPRRCLFIGGEQLSWDLAADVRALASCRVVNHYGPTETCVGCCTFDCTTDVSSSSPGSVPVGQPIANVQVHVLDGRMEPVPVGVAGELCIGGAGLARGYWQAPAIDGAFVPDPFASDPGARLYRTGDRARRLVDGSIEFLGRADGQIKIRGFRVETAEIEAVLRQHPNVQQAAVVLREDDSGDRRLVAYCVSQFLPAPPNEELRTHLLDHLPSYMVPSALVSLDALPLTVNGKLDRTALPAPEKAAAASQRALVAARNDTEAAVAAIWAELLGIEQVSMEDDFFELGGHSLLATQVIARLRGKFGVHLPVHSLFTSPTAAGLAQVVAEAGAAQVVEEDAEMARLLEELEGLSDEEAERLLAVEVGKGDGDH